MPSWSRCLSSGSGGSKRICVTSGGAMATTTRSPEYTWPPAWTRAGWPGGSSTRETSLPSCTCRPRAIPEQTCCVPPLILRCCAAPGPSPTAATPPTRATNQSRQRKPTSDGGVARMVLQIMDMACLDSSCLRFLFITISTVNLSACAMSAFGSSTHFHGSLPYLVMRVFASSSNLAMNASSSTLASAGSVGSGYPQDSHMSFSAISFDHVCTSVTSFCDSISASNKSWVGPTHPPPMSAFCSQSSLPPTRSRASSTITLSDIERASRFFAHASPASPAPMTTTS
mmetsp:Transcript_58878/g.155863  ORF Transcript_58878/g.155863 Transcript_58878/m.155863 type:complete len:285 (-) Transcript_58878:101-955(-)